MLGRSCAALAGLALAFGTLAATAPASASASAPAAAHRVATGPMIRADHGTPPMIAHSGARNSVESSNWSGYAANGSKYSSVSANWTEPTAKCSGSTQYAAFWVGLDGYSSDSVEQTGTDSDCDGGSPDYYGWYEMYPADPVYYTNPVSPGDSFSASVTVSGSKYTLVLTDHTKGWTKTQNITEGGLSDSSAEAIVEAPCCTSSGGPLPLADFGTIPFSSVTVNGSPISDFNPTEIIMVDNSGRDKDSISSSSDGNSFTATWLRAS
jgi:Peptidase A4 family